MEQLEPMHDDRHRSSFNIGLIAGIVVIFLGLQADYIWVVLGVGMVAYSWFTTPSRYRIYSDRLTVYYGRPRVRHVIFDDIEGAEAVTLPMSSVRLLVRLRNRKRLLIQPRDNQEFLTQLQGALEAHRGHQTSDYWEGLEG